MRFALYLFIIISHQPGAAQTACAPAEVQRQYKRHGTRNTPAPAFRRHPRQVAQRRLHYHEMAAAKRPRHMPCGAFTQRSESVRHILTQWPGAYSCAVSEATGWSSVH
ncbi:hypothetical protein HYPSUDRAFT_39204 [Hypholoma sublateritium FD-334 SS-4]|uniref:Secreted protein n=1 Tax=Hypholoma sublateritium (strain FD-334 SS-4) TaxID=945553 RepID=A0A0D2NZE9_HYPSF|nr:hypothetical protein HYPSUDRAFT_39204 [Hypholoma sublateritium FD-334 SS-4]